MRSEQARFLSFFVPFYLQSEGLRGTVGGSPRCVPAGTYFAPPPFLKITTVGTKVLFLHMCATTTHTYVPCAVCHFLTIRVEK